VTSSAALRLCASLLLFAAGIWIASPARRGLYEFSWSHPMVMLVGQFLLLAAASLAPRWRAAALAPFWVFSGMTAGPLLARASEAMGGPGRAALATAIAIAAAAALYLELWREERGVGQTRQAQ
jgi:hypothetical protein